MRVGPQRYQEMDVAAQALFLTRCADIHARFDFEALAPTLRPPVTEVPLISV